VSPSERADQDRRTGTCPRVRPLHWPARHSRATVRELRGQDRQHFTSNWSPAAADRGCRRGTTGSSDASLARIGRHSCRCVWERELTASCNVSWACGMLDRDRAWLPTASLTRVCRKLGLAPDVGQSASRYGGPVGGIARRSHSRRMGKPLVPDRRRGVGASLPHTHARVVPESRSDRGREAVLSVQLFLDRVDAMTAANARSEQKAPKPPGALQSAGSPPKFGNERGACWPSSVGRQRLKCRFQVTKGPNSRNPNKRCRIHPWDRLRRSRQ
jgi:hypothetical protein